MIYIIGNSFCGSTLLGFLMSSNPHIVFIGELKIKTWLGERSCSCGQPISSCLFYSDYFNTLNDIKKSVFQDVFPRSVISLLFRRHKVISRDAVEKLESFYKSVNDKVVDFYPGAKFIVDSSKSIWLLNGWLHTSIAKDIKIIWLKRPLKPNVASFLKRGSKFFPSLASVFANNVLTKYFLKWNHLQFLELDYIDFYGSYPDVAAFMSTFLSAHIPSAYKNHHNHHVIAGNSLTRKEFTGNFRGFHKDEEWKSILTSTQKYILSWFE